MPISKQLTQDDAKDREDGAALSMLKLPALNGPIDVDAGIADLVRALNYCHFETAYSCEGHRDGDRCSHPWVILKKGADMDASFIDEFNGTSKIKWTLLDKEDRQKLLPLTNWFRCKDCLFDFLLDVGYSVRTAFDILLLRIEQPPAIKHERLEPYIKAGYLQAYSDFDSLFTEFRQFKHTTKEELNELQESAEEMALFLYRKAKR